MYTSEKYLAEYGISFPKNEYNDLKKRLRKGLPIYSIRVDKEYEVYNTDEVYKTPWGDKVKVIEKRRLTSIKQYEFYNELSSKVRRELNKYNKLEVLKLVRT